MARPLREEFPGAVYHVTSRGNERKEMFRDDQDRKMFLDTLAGVNLRYNWLCQAYCLMRIITLCLLIHPMEIFRYARGS